METVLIIIHLLIVLALIGVVLLQRSEGGMGLSGGSGVSGFMTGRGQANALTRATAILAGLFFITSIGLTILSGYSGAPRSILDGAAPASGTPQGGNVLEQLQRLQGDQPTQNQAPAPAAPSVPFQAPATPSAPQVPQSQ